ncbi:MAG: hypothetical protein Q9168_007394 [Polycauliona sp. 1 TL-2023]
MAASKPTRRAGTGRRAGSTRAKSARPKTRNLIRWTDELDKKLLLTIQWGCNSKGIKLPWETIANEMSASINSELTESAIVQHLAKFRTRMVQQGLSVPPPLSRGGTAHISGTASKTAKAAPSKARNTRRKTKAADKSSKSNDTSEEEVAENTDSSSEAVAREKPASKAKGSSKGKKSIKEVDLDDNESEFDAVKEEPTSSVEDSDSKPRYGVGDAMWSMDGTGEGVGKRVRSLSGTPEMLSKVVVLNVGRETFAKLGLSGQVEDSEAGDDVTDYHSGSSDNSSNYDSDGNASLIEHALYGGAEVSEAPDSYHNPYGHKTLGSSQGGMLEAKYEDLGYIGHHGFAGNLLPQMAAISDMPPFIPGMGHINNIRAGNGVSHFANGDLYPGHWHLSSILPDGDRVDQSSYPSAGQPQDSEGMNCMISGADSDPDVLNDWDDLLNSDHVDFGF